jgi:hypothetical protein
MNLKENFGIGHTDKMANQRRRLLGEQFTPFWIKQNEVTAQA